MSATPVTRQSEARRGELLAAARRVVEQHGFAGATVGAITREAGASLGLLNYHFGSRDQVVAQVFAQLADDDLEELRRIDAHDHDAHGRLWAWVAANDPFDRECWRLWVDAWGESLHAEAMARILEGYGREFGASLRRTIEAGVDEGAWACADPAASAAAISAAVDGIGLHAIVHADEVEAGVARAWIVEVLERHLGVALTDPRAVPAAPPAPAAEIEIALRGRDLDARGRVRAAAQVTLLEEARDAALAAAYPDGAPDADQDRLELIHHRPIVREDAPLRATCALRGVGESTVHAAARLVCADGTTATIAHSRLVAR